jgi:hypothetical protein
MLTYEPLIASASESPRVNAPPTIPVADGDLFTGGRLTLDATVDLGRELQTAFNLKKLAPRVVYILSGKGPVPFSPVHLKGIHLVLYFEPPVSVEDRLTLVPNQESTGDADALIDVEDGGLEIIGGAIRFPDIKVARLPAHLIKARGSDLTLAECWLQGPVVQSPNTYRGLVRYEAIASAALSDRLPSCSFTDSVLISDRSCLDLTSNGARLRFENCAFVAARDVFAVEVAPGAEGALAMQWLMRHNTVAAKRSVFLLGAKSSTEPVLVQAEANTFMDPFVGTPKSSVLLVEGDALAHGALAWRGSDNVYDKRLAAYIAALEEPLPERQDLVATVRRLWGPVGDRKRIYYALTPPKPLLDLAAAPLRLDRLALPKEFKDEPLPGADLVQLGLVKPPKKSKPTGLGKPGDRT